MAPLHGLIFNVTQFPYLSRPLGGHRIAHYLRERDWDIEVVDWANWWSLDQLKCFFLSRVNPETKFVGFSHLFNIWSPTLEDFGAWIKTQFPGIKLISGSAVNPMFKSQCLDYYIRGFGEYAIEQLLKYIVGNGSCPVFNLTVPNGIKVIDAIHAYPAFPMQSLMVRYEDRDFIQPNEWLSIETARGCVFNCAYCNFPVLGVKGDYTRTQEDFEWQLRDAHDRFGVSCYMVADETFNDRSEKITKFADVVDNLDFVPWFSAYIRADLLIARSHDREELLRMNCLGHFYGIESFNRDSAKMMGKGMDSERLKTGLLDIRNYFESHGRQLYRGSIGLIAGLPHDTKALLDQNHAWLVENWQQHSFTLRPLIIPADDKVNNMSKMSADLDRYGYEPMTTQEIDRCRQTFTDLQNLHRSGILGEELIWKNHHMNWFDAKQYCEDIIVDKKRHDFRPNCHDIGHRLVGGYRDPAERLQLTYSQLEQLVDKDISGYIEKKLQR